MMLRALLISILLMGQVFAKDLSVMEKLADFGQLVSMIRAGYGPLEYKRTKGMDIDQIVERYTGLIPNTKNNSEYYYLIVRFVAEFNDSHFGARIPTDHAATLNFDTDLVDGKVLIDQINRAKLSEAEFPFQHGDEIVEMGGKTTNEVLSELYPYMGQGQRLSALRRAAMMMTNRLGAQVPVPSGKVKLKVRRGTSDIVEEVDLEWTHKGTPLDEYVADDTNKSNYVLARTVNYDSIALDTDETKIGNSFRCSGTTRIKIPEGATVIMTEPFVAYYHDTPKGKVGYLRIPHYSPSEKDSDIDAYELRFSQYEYAVDQLERNTVGLIIDQDHNCGGSVSYLHKILTLFINQQFPPVMFELLTTKESYLDFKDWLDAVEDTHQYTIEYREALETREVVRQAWLNGTDFLTKKVPVWAPKTNYPHSVNYSKPIIVLIDELSGSGGDAFPAMMQGNHRAKLLGTRTMGAGGNVISLPPLAYSQIKVRMTKSLFYHPNNIAIENNGASPDIEYTPTRDDFMYEYQNYQRFYLNELYKLLN